MSKLYDGADYNNLNFEYVGPIKYVSFYEYKDSKECFDETKNSQIKFSEVKNKENKFLNKLNNIKIGEKKLSNKKKRLITLQHFTILEKKLLFSLKIILKWSLMLITIQNKMKLREKDLKY